MGAHYNNIIMVCFFYCCIFFLLWGYVFSITNLFVVLCAIPYASACTVANMHLGLGGIAVCNSQHEVYCESVYNVIIQMHHTRAHDDIIIIAATKMMMSSCALDHKCQTPLN